MRIVRHLSVLSVVLAVTPLCFAAGLAGESDRLPAGEVVAPQALMEAAENLMGLGVTELPAVREMEPHELAAVAEFFDELKPDWMVDIQASSTIAPQSSGGGCYYACYDLEDSSSFCPPGKNFALEATGPFYNCYIVGGTACISSGCAVHISACSGFASNCSGGGGF